MNKHHLNSQKLTRKFSFFLMLLAIMLMPAISFASHFRGGNIKWERVPGAPYQIKFTVTEAWRTSAFFTGAPPTVGSTVTTGSFFPGTGSAVSVNLVITSVNTAEDWFTGSFTVTRAFPTSPAVATYTAYEETCCRISGLSNNNGGNFRFESKVTVGNSNDGPVSSVPPFISLPRNTTAATYQIPATDPNGDPLTFSLTPAGGMGSGTTQPPGLTISSTGLLSFNTMNMPVGRLWSTSVTITDSKGATTMVDLMIKIANTSTPPVYDYTVTPANNFNYLIQPGQNVNFNVKASDVDAGDVVSLSAVGLPAGASFTPGSGNPVTRSFSWTPTTNQLGTFLINFTAQDAVGIQTSSIVRITVSLKPNFVLPSLANRSYICITPGTQRVDTFKASDPDAADRVVITAASGVLPGMNFSPTLPTTLANPGQTVLSWTPTPAQWGINRLVMRATDTYSETTDDTVYYIVNNAPTFTTTQGNATIVAGQPFSYVFGTTDVNIPYGDVVDTTHIHLPSWLSIVNNGNGTFTLSGTPSSSDIGTHHVTLNIEDKGNHIGGTHCGQATQNFNITVQPCNISTSTAVTDVTCVGLSNGAIDLTVNNAASPISYSWSNGATTQDLNNIPAGTYNVNIIDGNGCTASASATTVAINQSPAITSCPANIVANTEAGSCTKAIDYTVSAEGTPAATYSYTFTGATTASGSGTGTGALFNKGVTNVTVTATNVCGSVDCNFTVEVNDNEAPVLSCPANVSVNNDAGVCGANVSYTMPVGTDNCPGAVTTQIAGLGSGSLFPIGTTTNTFRVVDASGNSTTCSFNITVTDNENPVIACPANISMNNDAGICGAIVTYNTPTGTDNCVGAVTTQIAGLASGATFPVGVTTNTFKVTDLKGNSSTCSFTVTVIDSEQPAIACAANVTVNAAFNQCSANVTVPKPTVADNCSTFGTGTTTMKLYINGNLVSTANNVAQYNGSGGISIGQHQPSGGCNAIIKVDDVRIWNTARTAGQISTNMNNTLSGSESGLIAYYNCDQGVADGNNTAITSLIDAAPAGGLNNGTFGNVQLTGSNSNFTTGAFAGSGNALALMNNNDFISIGSPIAANSSYTKECWVYAGSGSCDNIISSSLEPFWLSSGALRAGQAGNYNVVSGAGNFPMNQWVHVAVTYDNGVSNGTIINDRNNTADASGTYPVGTTAVRWIATDAAGNKDTCFQNVTVVDNQPPVIACPANISVNAAAGQCGANVSYNSPVGTDNCSAPITTQIAGLPSGSFFPVGTTTNTFRVTDAKGLSTTCSFNVTVIDNQDPVINCNANISVNNDAGVCGAVVNYNAPVGTDNCPGATTVQIAGLASGAIFPIGVTTNTFRVTDAHGRTAVCSFTVTVTDNENPVIACPANISVSNDAGVCGANVNYNTPVGTDNCPGAVTTQIAGLASGSVFPVGTTTNTFRVLDAYNNSTTCSFTVTVKAADVSIAGNGNTIADGDNTPAMADNTDFGGTNPLVAVTRTYTISNNGTADLDVNAINITGVDASSFMVSGISLPVTVGAGNTATFYVVFNESSLGIKTAELAVVTSDCDAPVYNYAIQGEITCAPASFTACPANIDVNNATGTCGEVVNYVATTDGTPSATVTYTFSGATNANGSGTGSGSVFNVGVTTVTINATNPCSNVNCTFTVTVTDNENPVIACPANISVNNDAGVCGANVIYNTPVGADNCPGAVTTQIAGLASGSVFPVGTTTNTFKVADAHGNSVTCSFDVTVIDNEKPVVVFPANTTVMYGTSTATSATGIATGTDNCGGTVVVNNTDASTQGSNINSADYYNYVITRTWTGTDLAGNTTTGVQLITVQDITAPSITCPANFAASCNTTPASTGMAIGQDLSPVTISYTDASTQTTDPLLATTYAYTITRTWKATDVSGNFTTCAQVINVNAMRNAAIAVTPGTTVAGQGANTIYLGYGPQSVTLAGSVAGGVGGFTYSWTPTTGVANPTALTTSVAPTATTTYTLTITDSKGCSVTTTKTIYVQDVRDGNKVELCHNGNTISVSSNAVPVHLNHGDKLGRCFEVAGSANKATCYGGNNGSINATVSGGIAPYTYNWSNGATTEDISGLTAGNYTLTVTAANGVTTSEMFTVTQNSRINVSGAITNVKCNGDASGKITLSVYGGGYSYTYLWNDGSTAKNRTNLAAGTYIVTVTDNNGCSVNDTSVITQPATAISVTAAITHVKCNGADDGKIDITVTGGTAPYSYDWNDNNSNNHSHHGNCGNGWISWLSHWCFYHSNNCGNSSQDLNNIDAGTYSVTVTDANGCEKTVAFTVNEPSALVVTGVRSNPTCVGNDGEIDVTVAGGTAPYTYKWNNNSTTEDRTNLTAGTYSVKVKDANGCEKMVSFTLSQATGLTAGISVNPSPTVSGQQSNTIYKGFGAQSVTLTATPGNGTAPYTYSWTPSATVASRYTAATLVTPSSTTTYSVTITDANGCTKTVSKTINVVDPRGSGDKVKLCHNGNTIQVSPSALATHLAHGDNLGECEDNCNRNVVPDNDHQDHEDEVNAGEAAIAETTTDGSNETTDGATTAEGQHHKAGNALDVTSDMNTERFNVYPNPNNGSFKVELPAHIWSGAVIVRDMLGKEIKRTAVSRVADVAINMSEVSDGVYTVELVNGNEYHKARVVIRR